MIERRENLAVVLAVMNANIMHYNAYHGASFMRFGVPPCIYSYDETNGY